MLVKPRLSQCSDYILHFSGGIYPDKLAILDNEFIRMINSLFHKPVPIPNAKETSGIALAQNQFEKHQYDVTMSHISTNSLFFYMSCSVYVKNSDLCLKRKGVTFSVPSRYISPPHLQK